MSHNVCAPLLARFAESPEKEWITCEGESLKGREVLSTVRRTQRVLTASGIGRGDRVLVFGERGHQFWTDMVSLWGLGAVGVPLESQISEAHLSHVLSRAEPNAFLGEARQCSDVLQSLRAISLDPAPSGNRGAHAPICEPVPGDELATILFTSGSTGEPKGVALSHTAVAGNAVATCESIRLEGHRKLLAPIPFRFVSALSHFVATLFAGVAYAGTERRLLQADLIEFVQASGADAFGGSPLQARWLAEAGRDVDWQLRWLMSSGDNLPVQVIKQLRESIPDLAVVTAYGLTEVAGRFCILAPRLVDRLAGSVGRPIRGLSLSVRDDEGRMLPPGEIGEVHVQGEYVFAGYIRDEEKTHACMSPSGFATGDLGQLDEEGFLTLSGRSDDVFKSGGLKVSTLPIAAALMKLGIFADVAVVPMDDAVLGQTPHVFYTLKQGAEFRKGKLMNELRSVLSSSHLPRRYTEVDVIPRTGSGKLRRAELRALVARMKQ